MAMATIKIEPLAVQSLGGNRVVITGLTPTYQHCINGGTCQESCAAELILSTSE